MFKTLATVVFVNAVAKQIKLAGERFLAEKEPEIHDFITEYQRKTMDARHNYMRQVGEAWRNKKAENPQSSTEKIFDINAAILKPGIDTLEQATEDNRELVYNSDLVFTSTGTVLKDRHGVFTPKADAR